MIMRDYPSSFQLFFILKGSVIPNIYGKIIGVALLSIAVLLVDHFIVKLPHVSIAAMGIFGVALSLFLGFRNNAAYDRWWEARKLWGNMIADIRNLGRSLTIFMPDKSKHADILSLAVAFAHLHRGFLRGVDASGEITPWIGADQAKELIAHRNPANAALNSLAQKIEDDQSLSGFGQLKIAELLLSLGTAQAGCERIVTTPLPYVYSLLVRRTTYLYCGLLPFALIESTGWFAPFFSAVVAYVFFGLQTVTNELELPFRHVQNGLALDAMCRTIEISVCETLDREPPADWTVVDHVLT